MATSTTNPTVRASVRYLHTSPYKIRQVLTLIRGLPVGDAERALQLCEKDAADDVLKLLTSAIANAEHNNALPADELFVSLAWADEGPTRKHGQPRARGRYFRIRKRTSHVTIVLERFAVEELAVRRSREEASGRGAAVSQRRRAERVRRSRAAEAESTDDTDTLADDTLEDGAPAGDEALDEGASMEPAAADSPDAAAPEAADTNDAVQAEAPPDAEPEADKGEED
ncbi:MAG TPA: 50S ribosomal protein L22 [Acidimicrobiia bacterium]|nr:50S ribosomal protein L22 [Acidimicrobiia bacterium]